MFFHITRCGIWSFSFDSLLSDIFFLSLFFVFSCFKSLMVTQNLVSKVKRLELGNGMYLQETSF